MPIEYTTESAIKHTTGNSIFNKKSPFIMQVAIMLWLHVK